MRRTLVSPKLGGWGDSARFCPTRGICGRKGREKEILAGLGWGVTAGPQLQGRDTWTLGFSGNSLENYQSGGLCKTGPGPSQKVREQTELGEVKETSVNQPRRGWESGNGRAGWPPPRRSSKRPRGSRTPRVTIEHETILLQYHRGDLLDLSDTQVEAGSGGKKEEENRCFSRRA